MCFPSKSLPCADIYIDGKTSTVGRHVEHFLLLLPALLLVLHLVDVFLASLVHTNHCLFGKCFPYLLCRCPLPFLLPVNIKWRKPNCCIPALLYSLTQSIRKSLPLWEEAGALCTPIRVPVKGLVV